MADSKDKLAALYDGLTSAMDDVRQKVVEEPAYGRAVTENDTPEPAAAPECGKLETLYGIQVNIGDVHIDTSSREQNIDTGDIEIGDDD